MEKTYKIIIHYETNVKAEDDEGAVFGFFEEYNNNNLDSENFLTENMEIRKEEDERKQTK